MEQEQEEQVEQETVWLKVAVPGALHKRLRVQATQDGKTLKTLLNELLTQYLDFRTKT